ncbi:DNA polymerase I [Candidatus Omnitrophota bacterium]
MKEKRLYLIDAAGLCYRAFYAVKDLTTSFGQPTNAVYGFVTMLNKIIKDRKPEYLAICFDVSRETFRQKKYAEYKLQRPPMPDALGTQMPIIKQVIAAYGIRIVERKGYEADDVIATLNKKAKQAGFATTIVTSDKDMLQLVDDKTEVFSPYKDQGIVYDSGKVHERFGVAPSQVADVIALMGDKSDNIPGAEGIGEKTAADLIRRFGSLDLLLKGRSKVKSDKLREKLEASLEKIKLSRQLVELAQDVDVEFNPEDLKLGKPHSKELVKLFMHLEFKKFLKGMDVQDTRDAKAPEVLTVKNSKLKEMIAGCQELIVCGDSAQNLTLCSGKKVILPQGPGSNTADLLSDAKLRKIGHNLKALKISLRHEGITLDGLYFDTMVAAYLLNPSRPDFGLGALSTDYLKEFIPDEAIDGPKAAQLIRKLVPILENELKEKSLEKLFFELEMPLVGVLADMQLDGIKIDKKILADLSKVIEKKLIKLIDKIYDTSGTQFNINSTKQLRTVLFEKLKLPVVKRGKTGPSTNEEVLKKLSSKHKLPALLLEYRQLTKLKSTYVDALPGLINPKTGRVHTSFNQTGTETGRLSSSNPNLQNIPVKTDIGSEIRRAIVAGGKDTWLLSCDYSQIELRVLAHISKDEELIAAFQDDKDIHKATASLIYGLDEDDLEPSMRDMAKRVNFGIVYGLSSWGLSRDLEIPKEEAQSFIDAYFERFARVREYIDEQIAKAERDGFVTTILGRRRYIPEIHNKNQGIRMFAQRQAVNTPIQGSASDLIKMAMVRIQEDIKGEKLGAKMVLQIHDELLFEVPGKELDDFAKLVRERMENVLKLVIPVRVDIKKGRNWLEMKKL